ncbi:MAG: GNAT family N-acetyltransferase [Candidatus Elarobacter sp.]
MRRLWFLSDLFVDPAARGHGIARALIAQVEHHARETGAKGLLVEIPFSEPKLTGLYEAAGYRKDAVFDVYRLGVGAPAR